MLSENNDNPEEIRDKDKTQKSVLPKTTTRSLIKTVASYLPAQATPLQKPVIDDDFIDSPTIERVYESIKYNTLCFEYSISPKGGLRQWIKLNISILLLFGIPILIFVPLATYFVGGFANISQLLAMGTKFLFDCALNILKTIFVLIAIVSVIYIILKLIAFFFQKRSDRSNNKNDYINVPPNSK